MIFDPRWLIALIVNLLLTFLLQQANDLVAPLALHLTTLGLLITFPALFLPIGQALLVSIVTALFYDATLPVTYGLGMFISVILVLLLQSLRTRLHPESVPQCITIALILNLIYYVPYTLSAPVEMFAYGAFWVSITINFIVSQLVVATLTWWYIELHSSLFRIFGLNLNPSERGITA